MISFERDLGARILSFSNVLFILRLLFSRRALIPVGVGLKRLVPLVGSSLSSIAEPGATIFAKASIGSYRAVFLTGAVFFTTGVQRVTDTPTFRSGRTWTLARISCFALRSFLWDASTDRPDHWPSVASSIVPSDSTKNEPQRHKGTKISLHIAV